MKQKIIMINGSPRMNGGTSAAFRILRQELLKEGAAVTEYRLNTMNFRGCQGCMGCKRREGCVLYDDLTEVLQSLKSADGLIIGSPIYMFAVSGQMSLFINRLYSLINRYYQPYAGKVRKLMTVYSMGSPSAGYAEAEEQRIQAAMKMLGFRETERIEVTGVMPGQTIEGLPEYLERSLIRKADRWVRDAIAE